MTEDTKQVLVVVAAATAILIAIVAGVSYYNHVQAQARETCYVQTHASEHCG